MPVVQISEFTKKVLQLVHSVPEGKVATYKQIAILAGKPQGARGVSWILHSCSTRYKLPWHRILNSQGKVSFERGSSHFREQIRRLRREGVVMSSDGELELSRFQWRKKARVRLKRGQPQIFSD